ARSSRMQVVLPGIETPERPSQTISTSAVMVGRLHPVKDHATALRAWAQVGSSSTRPTLTLVGDGPERGRLQALASELGIADVVDFVGETDPRPYLYGASMFVSTSVAEGFSRSLLEALLAGVPSVATAVGGVLDLPAGTVRIVPAGDPGAIAAVLLDVLADPDASKRAAETARAVATNFSLSACHRSYRRLYAQMGAI
ncbi:MAG: glycosyltransferase, partial [Pseudonocardiaceae bacterium]